LPTTRHRCKLDL